MDIYGLIGWKLGHSFSAKYFNEKFERENIDAHYELFEIPSIEGISNIICKYPELRGLNVTIPYKRDILPYCDTLTESAREIGAVNTVRIERCDNGDVRLHGHNTDAPGFWEAIRPMLTGLLKYDNNPDGNKAAECGYNAKALVLGQGGASLAVIYALRKAGTDVVKVSRKPAKGVITYAEISEQLIKECRIIVNCTPLGMWPNVEECVDIPYEYLGPGHICFDLVYNPETTEFMKRCAAAGASVSNGLQMLHNQAELAWKFWTNS